MEFLDGPFSIGYLAHAAYGRMRGVIIAPDEENIGARHRPLGAWLRVLRNVFLNSRPNDNLKPAPKAGKRGVLLVC
jgi:hypothetical protein